MRGAPHILRTIRIAQERRRKSVRELDDIVDQLHHECVQVQTENVALYRAFLQVAREEMEQNSSTSDGEGIYNAQQKRVLNRIRSAEDNLKKRDAKYSKLQKRLTELRNSIKTDQSKLEETVKSLNETRNSMISIVTKPMYMDSGSMHQTYTGHSLLSPFKKQERTRGKRKEVGVAKSARTIAQKTSDELSTLPSHGTSRNKKLRLEEEKIAENSSSSILSVRRDKLEYAKGTDTLSW